MIRRFKFEGELPEELDQVPMAVRRKLDRVGLKIGLEDWRAFGRGERLAICHLPANLEEECETLRVFIREALKRLNGVEPRLLTEAERRNAEPLDEPPALLMERARAFGFELSPESWNKLDSDERYALTKLGAGTRASHNLEAALKEFFEAKPSAVVRIKR